jgi:hypothetical protein
MASRQRLKVSRCGYSDAGKLSKRNFTVENVTPEAVSAQGILMGQRTNDP